MTIKYHLSSRLVAVITTLTILFTFSTYQFVVGAPNEWLGDEMLSLNRTDDDSEATVIAETSQNIALRKEAIFKEIIVPDGSDHTLVSGDRSCGGDTVVSDNYSRRLISELSDLLGRLELQLTDWGWSFTIKFARLPSYDSTPLGSILGIKLWYPIK